MMEKLKRIHPKIRKTVRYQLVQKMMEDNLVKWFSQPSTISLVEKLIEDCKKKNITLSTPNPIFINKMNNSLTNSQIITSHFIPPMSPNSATLQNHQLDSKVILPESALGNEDKKKLTESNANPMLTSMKLSTIPKFYYPENYIGPDLIEQENTIINEVFSANEISSAQLLPITQKLYDFPPLFNCVLYDKIAIDNKETITKEQFTNYHNANFRGISNVKKYFNFIKSPRRKEIIREDFIPFLNALLELNPSLDFLKQHPTYQKKYSDTVIMRIFYINDINDDGKITLREFKKSNLIAILKSASEEDINLVRDYFSYEHFYVIYCIFFELDSNKEPEKELYISKECFSKYDAHSLGKKSVDRIYDQVPRKFRSGQADKMCFEDFLWYLLSEEDKTTRTSIEYWFKILDLDNNGIVTPHEMEYFYSEQIQRFESLQNEVIKFSDVLCQMCDMIPSSNEYQWTLQNFLDHADSASTVFNSLFNLNKFIENEQKDPFNRTEIDQMVNYTDWDKFAYKEYYRKMAEENDENEEEEEPVIDSAEDT